MNINSTQWIKPCLGCSSDLDIEVVLFENVCEYCGCSQGYDLEVRFLW